MTLSKAQRGVALGALSALAFSLAVLVGAAILLVPDAWSASLAGRLQTLGLAVLGPAATLLLSIGRLAHHRFGSPADIDGGGLSLGTPRAKLLQALLQNTLEQFVLALGVYGAWAALAPVRLGGVLWGASALFVLGRLLFFWGYARGAAGRAMGFGLTFYPTALMLAGLLAGCAAFAVLVDAQP